MEGIILSKKYNNSLNILSTAVQQSIPCAPGPQRPRIQSSVWTSFLGEVSPGFTSSVRQM